MDPLSIAYLTSESVIGLVSVVGNAIVLVAIYKTPSLQTVTNCFIASLALADLLVGIVVAPCAALSYLGLPRNFIGCVFLNSVVILFTQISIFSLLAVAVERFLAIKHPFAYQRYLTISRSLYILVVTWILAVIIGLVPVFGWNLGPPANGHFDLCAFTGVVDMKYMVYFNFMGFVLTPLLVMLFIYVYIFSIVRKQMRKIAALEITIPGKKKTKQFFREIKAAKSLAMVLGLFAVCWLPIHACNCVTLFCGVNCYLPPAVLLGAIILSHANSVFNPFLYAYGNGRFKLAFKQLFGCKTDSPRTSTGEDYSTNNVNENSQQPDPVTRNCDKTN